MKKTVQGPSYFRRSIIKPTATLPFIISAALILLSAQVSTDAARSRSNAKRQLSLEQIDARMSLLQERVDSLKQVLSSLRQDSSNLFKESNRQTASLQKQRSSIQEALDKKKIMAGGFRTQYEKAKQDSSEIVARNKEQMTALHKEIVALESSILTMSNELDLLTKRSDRLSEPSTAADKKTKASLEAQIRRNDSLLTVRQEDFSSLSKRREKLRKDSIEAENKINAGRLEFRMQVAGIDSSIEAIDAEIAKAEKKLAANEEKKEKKAADLNKTIASLTGQKRGLSDRVNRAETEITQLTAEKKRIAQTADVAQKRHKQIRAPLEKALADAEEQLEVAKEEYSLLKALHDKLRLDSAISKTRDLLDKAIQAEAERKRGAKKEVENRENELNEHLKIIDSIKQNTPGLRQKEASFPAPTIAQKKGKVKDALDAAKKPVALAKEKHDKAKQDLKDFDVKNPPPADPTKKETAVIDKTIAAKKKEIIQMTEQLDSLDMALEQMQSSLDLLAKPVKGKPAKDDSEVLSKKKEKRSLVSERAKIVKDSSGNEKANAGSILRIKNSLASIGGKMIATQNEVTKLTSARDNAKKALADLKTKIKNAATSQKAEKEKIDSSIAAKQQSITLVSMKSEKLRQDSMTIAKREAQQLKNLDPPPSMFGQQLANAEKEVAQLQATSDSLNRIIQASQAQPAKQARKISLEITAVSRSLSAARREIEQLEKAKEAAFERLKNDKDKFESLVNATEQDIAQAISKRDQSRKDSIAASANVRQTSDKIKENIKEKETTIAALQKELARLDKDLVRAKEDSAAAGRKLAKCRADVAGKKSDLRRVVSEKKEFLTDTVAFKRKSRQELATATAAINQQNDLIQRKKAELARLKKLLDEIAARTGTTRGSGAVTVIEDKKAQKESAASSPPPTPRQIAQKRSEELYVMLGENRVGEAAKRFNQLNKFLKANLDPEAYDILKTTIEQMGGSVK
ncbi:MAG: hypothetical protein JW768_05630 [Chitinispirillaceae bacterium]|nr:hypothetical protein [Chitinispirillaceae bacterium]